MVKTAPFTIILVESALERIDFLSKNKKVVRTAQEKRKKPLEKTLLDVSIHNHLMGKLPEKNKRGRPDIIHNSLLLALESRLNKEGYLQIYVHTRNDEILTFNPEVRIPRNYNRFVGLMEQLFDIKKIPPNSEQILISMSSQSLEEFLHKLDPNLVVLFTENGLPTNDIKLQKIFSENNKVVALIGGFPHGDFSQKIYKLADMKLSIYSEPLNTLVVISSLIHNAEQSLKKVE
ncbi:MAG: 16S rRNA methyltransferase [Candidatus Helarchaeota archaeon]|nr:16S rRNA methyltransferase [Candidatus Helarchaeota archaeon]